MPKVILSVFLGLAIGWKGKFSPKTRRIVSRLSWVSLLGLLCLMGITIGNSQDVMNHLPQMGFTAIFLSFMSVLGSVFVTWLFFGKKRIAAEKKETIPNPYAGKLTFMVFSDVALGVLLGRLVPGTLSSKIIETLSQMALGLLLAGVGFDLGCEKQVWQRIKPLGLRVLLVPFSVAVGTLLGSYAAGSFLGLTPSESLSVGAGFGWYSLSAVLLSQVRGPELGTLAFLSNVSREIMAVASIPLCAKYLGDVVAVAPGGATSMDTTLPIVEKAAGLDASIVSFISGAVLTALVPILVPLFAKL